MHRALCNVRRATAGHASRAVLGAAALSLLAACGHQAPIETGLNTDLALADQLQRRNAPTLVSTQELAEPASAPAPAVTRATSLGTPSPIVHTRTVIRTVQRAADAASVEPRAAVYTPRPSGTRSAASSTRTPATVDRATDGEVVETEPVESTDRSSVARDGSYDAGVYRGDTERSASATTGATTTGGSVYRPQVQTHTARDGVLGSIAGAIIGAAASHGDRVRGGLLGAVAGGALGAVYGHSVDHTYADAGAYPTYRPSTSFRRTPRYRGVI